MGLTDNYSGIGMSPRPRREHQNILRNLIIAITDEGYYCLTEFCVDENDLNSPAPDIVIYASNDDSTPQTIIEVTTRVEYKTICAKAKQLLTKYPITECFVYDYETRRWACYGQNVDTAEPSYSPLLEIDFADYVD